MSHATRVRRFFCLWGLCASLWSTPAGLIARSAVVVTDPAGTESARIDPPGAQNVDASCGNCGLAAFNRLEGRHTITFDQPEFTKNQRLDKVVLGKPVGVTLTFQGFAIGTDPTRNTSPPQHVGCEAPLGRWAASIRLSRPVASFGMTVMFAGGGLLVEFLDDAGNVLSRIRQNGRADPEPAGEWMDFFFGYRAPDQEAVIRRVRFKRLYASGYFGIDDVSFVLGRLPVAIIPPEYAVHDLTPLAGADRPDICPQIGSGAGARIATGDETVVLRPRDGEADVEYRLRPGLGLDSIEGRFRGGPWAPLTRGLRFRLAGKGAAAPSGRGRRRPMEKSDARAELVGTQTDGQAGALRLAYRYTTAGGQRLAVSADLTLSGGSLRLRLSSPQGVPLEILRPVPDAAAGVKDITFLLGYDGTVKYLPEQKLFFSYLVDWTQTNSSVPAPNIVYVPSLDGKIAPLRETIALTLSDSIDGVLPSIPNPPSPYRGLMANSMVLEIWRGHFAEIGELLDRYHGYGMDRIVALVHRWQRYGFDTKLPVHFPPNPRRGGLRTLREAVAPAVRRGQRVALHENYVDMYPDSPLWNEHHLLKLATGDYCKSWGKSRHISPSHIMDYAGKTMPLIKKEIGTNACFLDVHSAQAPWFRTDFRAGVRGAGTMAATREFTNRLWRFARKVYGGPVIGEGCYSWVHAGCLDSVMAQTNRSARFFVDFALLKIRPLQINHGAGYFERWNPRGYRQPDWQVCPLTPEEMDDYRASEVAYQTAATVNDQIKRNITLAAREYYLVRPLTAHLYDCKVKSIRYHDGRNWLSSSQAVLVRSKSKVRRVEIVFENGTVIHVNRSAKPWKIDAKTRIGPYGFLARGGGVEAFTNNPNGHWYDYFAGPDLYFLDPRNVDWSIDTLGSAWFGTDQKEPVRSNSGELVVARGPIETDLAVACIREGPGWRLRFFPQRACGVVKLALKGIGRQGAKATALDRMGNPIETPRDSVRIGGGVLVIAHHDPNVWSYRLMPAKD